MYSDPELPFAADSGVFHLRPLNAGEVFDRTFAIYRRFFLLFIGIALLPALFAIGAAITRLLLLHYTHQSQYSGIWATPVLGISALAWWLLQVAAYGLSQAATTFALSSVYLGNAVTIGSAYRSALSHWFRYPTLAVVQILQALWLPAVLLFALLATIAGLAAVNVVPAYLIGAAVVLAMLALFPYMLYRFVKVSLAMPAAVVEGTPVIKSIQRSKRLLSERKWRVFLLMVLLFVLYLIVGSALAYLNLSALRGTTRLVVAQTVTIIINFFSSLLLQPIGAIGLCLFYFDERVRQEAFDIEFMMQGAVPPTSNFTAAEGGPEL